MAHVTLANGFGAEQYFYNVGEAVGPGMANRRIDVLLVQFFLKVTIDNPSSFRRPMPPPPGRPLVVDGIAGETTFRTIKAFQEHIKVGGQLAITADGRVDRAIGNGRGTISKNQFTVTFLNTAYKAVRPTQFRNISDSPDCPIDLASAVSLI